MFYLQVCLYQKSLHKLIRIFLVLIFLHQFQSKNQKDIYLHVNHLLQKLLFFYYTSHEKSIPELFFIKNNSVQSEDHTDKSLSLCFFGSFFLFCRLCFFFRLKLLDCSKDGLFLFLLTLHLPLSF